MKAKIKATGEIVNLAPYAKITLDQCDSWGNPVELKPEDIELIQEQTEDEHWQDVRERAAIAAMQGILSNSITRFTRDSLEIIPYNSVLIADALIEKLKKIILKKERL